MRPIVVYGATGFTGRLAAHALASRNVPLVLAGRDAARLSALSSLLPGKPEFRVAAANDRGALASAFRGASVVVSTVGPFLRHGRPVLEQALSAGAHYVDSTGEQRFALAARDFDGLARDRGVAAVPMLAFEYALGDLAASIFLAGRKTPLLDVLYWISKGEPSRGTAKTLLHVASSTGFQYREGALVEEALAKETRTFDVEGRGIGAFSFPAGEVLTVPRHASVRTVRGFYAGRPGTIRGLRVAIPFARAALRGRLLSWAESAVDRAVDDPSEVRRKAARFVIQLEAAGETYRVSGEDPYGLTGEILAEGARRLADPGTRAAGVVAPAEAFDAKDFLDSLAKRVPSLRFGRG